MADNPARETHRVVFVVHHSVLHVLGAHRSGGVAAHLSRRMKIVNVQAWSVWTLVVLL